MTEPGPATPGGGPPSTLPPVWSGPPPARRGPSPILLLGVAVAVLLVVGLALVLLLREDDGGTAAPQPSASPRASTSAPSSPPDSEGTSPSASPGGSPSAPPSQGPLSSAEAAALAAEIDRIEAQVPPIRGLQPLGEVPDRLLDQAALEEELRTSFAEDNPTEQVRAFGELYERLGLLPPDSDLQKLVLDLLGSSIAGFYDPDTKQMSIVQRGEAFGPLEKVTLAHEYTHALQDQHFDLGSLQTDDVEHGDRALGRLALIEGDATLLMSLWAQQHLSSEELLELVRQSNDPQSQAVLDRMPPILLRQTLFPYSDGLQFVSGLFTDDGWDAIDAAYEDPPDSTEQILHPEKYTAGEDPIEVTLPDLAEAFGDGWEQRAVDTMGEMNIQVWLQEAVGAAGSREGAAGWGGDRISYLEGPDEGWAVAWQTAWDNPQEAAEFEDAARQVTEELEGEIEVLAGEGSETVIVLLASDAEVLDLLGAPFQQPG